jgi:hypothetical protein
LTGLRAKTTIIPFLLQEADTINTRFHAVLMGSLSGTTSRLLVDKGVPFPPIYLLKKLLQLLPLRFHRVEEFSAFGAEKI